MEENTNQQVNPRRRKKTKMEIIKEAYLPTIIMIVTFIFIAVFIVGSLVRRDQANLNNASNQTSATTDLYDIYGEEITRLLNESEALALRYDYEAALQLINSFSGDITAFPELTERKSEYTFALSNMIVWSDPSQITALSMHNLIADPERAFVNKSYGKSYNRNFITIGEFTNILNQLYERGYVLVNLDDFTECITTDGGQTICQAKPLKLPAGKKPLLLIQTNANYYTYMIDSNGDGLGDKNGAGFASRLVVGNDGKITCEYVDSQGNTLYGDYDLVPILNRFLEEHPDFSYKGAKAILAPSGYNGIFGYRIDSSTKAKKGTAYYETQVAGAQRIVEALQEDGYQLACYTYKNSAYGNISAGEIQNDLRSWVSDITPVLGQTNILVFAQNSEIAEYSGSKFNVLQNAGFRNYIGFADTGVSTIGSNYITIKRLVVSGSQIAYTNAFQNYFTSDILDPNRGEIPRS